MTLGLLLLALAGPAAAAPYTEKSISIAVAHQARRLVLVPEGKFSAQDGRSVHALTPHQKYPLDAEGSDLRLGSLRLASETRLIPGDAEATLTIGSKRYRGTLLLRANSGETVTVIAELAMEEYLLGVLPYEMEPQWPLESLKAQAVVARTFAYYNMGKYRRSGFDLTSDTRSQMYGGLVPVYENVRRAVHETRGEVLGYKGQLLSVYYHACCGGRTQDQSAVWPSGAESPRPLKGVKDRYCAASPHFRWNVFFQDSDILEALQSRRMIGGGLKWLKAAKRDAAGMIRVFSAKIGSETMSLRATDLRKQLGNTELRSSRIRQVVRRKRGYEFQGGGNGHGVGLCQWGARLQADKGRRYEQILSFYFPGAVLSGVDE